MKRFTVTYETAHQREQRVSVIARDEGRAWMEAVIYEHMHHDGMAVRLVSVEQDVATAFTGDESSALSGRVPPCL